MQGHLIDEASKKIPSTQILINVISRRVRQLSNGHRALVEAPHSTGYSDLALMEVIQGKISFEATEGFKAEPLAPRDPDHRGFGSRAA
ncbi:MAG: DNA-directed RNA polymerase subunit omega [Chthoniobacteraceae bacterium]